MDQEQLASDSAMLQALIDGASCEEIAREHGIAKSAVSQRIRILACALQRVVGVEGVDEEVSPTAYLIREYGDAYLEALEHFVPTAAPALQSAEIHIASDKIERYVVKIAQHSRSVRRDTALLLTLFSTAAKPLEIAQLEVRDYLDPCGAHRPLSILRPEIAASGTARQLPFDDPATVGAIDAYLAERTSSASAAGRIAYRGIDPCSRLFLSRAGNPLQVKHAGPTGQHLVCKEIHEIYRRIFAYGGLTGANTALARRAAAHRLRINGANPEEIGEALGLRKLAVYKLLRHSEGLDAQPLIRTA
jgi:hypothetical protein